MVHEKNKATLRFFFVSPRQGGGILKPSKKTVLFCFVFHDKKSQPACFVFNTDMVASVAPFSLFFSIPE